jgi:Protein of unknown function (DUF3455)
MRCLSAILLLSAVLAAQEAPDVAAEKEVQRLAVPEKLTPKGKTLLFLLRAEGTQNYIAEKKGGKLVWTFQEPDAVLLDFRTGAKAGSHGKGPVWSDVAGGQVRAKLSASALAPRAGAVAWLLLEATGQPTGRFEKVTHIQRIDTWAGQPSSTPQNEGETKKVRYHATYAFWGGR